MHCNLWPLIKLHNTGFFCRQKRNRHGLAAVERCYCSPLWGGAGTFWSHFGEGPSPVLLGSTRRSKTDPVSPVPSSELIWRMVIRYLTDWLVDQLNQLSKLEQKNEPDPRSLKNCSSMIHYPDWQKQGEDKDNRKQCQAKKKKKRQQTGPAYNYNSMLVSWFKLLFTKQRELLDMLRYRDLQI